MNEIIILDKSNKFNTIGVNKKAVILSFKKNIEKEILFSDIDYISIRVYKLPVIYEYLLVLFSVVHAILSILYLKRDLLFLIPVLLIIYTYLRMKNWKWYGFVVHLKKGTII